MWRILLILGVVVATALFIVGRFILSNQETGSPLSLPKNFSLTDTKKESTATVSAILENRVRELEFSVTDLLSKTNSTSPVSTTTTSSLDTKIKALETSVNSLSSRIAKLEGSPAPSSSTTTGAKVAYIPIGYTGSGNSSSDFANVSGQEATIDTANYPGYKTMTLEVNFRIFQANGIGYVRLYNKTDGTSYSASEISTTSQDYATKTSNTFTIASGSKTYTIQAKSSTGYSVDLQWARVRVDF